MNWLFLIELTDLIDPNDLTVEHISEQDIADSNLVELMDAVLENPIKQSKNPLSENSTKSDEDGQKTKMRNTKKLNLKYFQTKKSTKLEKIVSLKELTSKQNRELKYLEASFSKKVPIILIVMET